MTAPGLAAQLGITEDAALKLISSYKAAFPTVMKYLDKVGDLAKATLEIRSVEGGRRRWRKPEWDTAKQLAIDDEAKKAKKEGREVRPVSQDAIRRKYLGMYRSIEREGKNAGIQRANAYLTKRAMYLAWLQLGPRFGAALISSIHDELVVECPEEHAEECYAFTRQTMSQAGAELIKGVYMDTEGSGPNETSWTK